MSNEKKSKKKIIVIAIIIILVLVFVLSKVLKKDEVQEPEFDTVAIEKQTLTTTISSTGKITTENSKTVTSQLMNYKITGVNVKVGDTVNVGDVLCTFDTADLAKTVNDLETTINVAGISGNAGIVASDIKVKQAEEQLNNTLAPIHDQVKQAEAAYQALDISLKDLKGQLAATTDEATRQILNDKIAESEGQYQQALAAHSAAVNEYNKVASSLNDAVALAKTQAESTAAQNSIASLSTEQQLTQYKKQLEDTNLKATTSGTVTAVNAKAGDYYTGGALLTIDGVESFVVEAEIDEYDIADISVGMEVNIKTDATRDEVLSGQVISVAPAATNSVASSAMGMSSMSTTSGSATYTVKIAINSQNDRLRLGMNSKISIITKKSENVLTVPYDAITEKEDGTKVITIIKGENSEEVIPVTVGLESGYYTEISSDKLKEGMKVKVPKVESSSGIDELLNSMGATAGM